jgi:hypothetical protein
MKYDIIKHMKMILSLFLCLFTSFESNAQIANASFFPSMRAINPGVAHLRTSGFVSLNSTKTKILKHKDVNLSTIQDGINIEVDLDKSTFFWATKGPGIAFELLLDQESGERVESMEFATFDRSTTTNGKSSVTGGAIDFGFIGITMAKASYQYLYDFSVGEIPNLNRITHDTNLDYTLTRIGAAFDLKGFSIGTFYSIQKAKGQVDSILFNPTTGGANVPEINEVSYETISYGFGLGYVTKTIHLEASLENISKQSLSESNTYLQDLETPPKGSRLSIVGEVKFAKVSLGLRTRQIKGNYSDLEQLISSNMLNTDESDTRLENSFNFAYGASKGFSFSGFYSTSKSDTEEKSGFQGIDFKYPTTTQITSMGLSISYVY